MYSIHGSFCAQHSVRREELQAAVATTMQDP